MSQAADPLCQITLQGAPLPAPAADIPRDRTGTQRVARPSRLRILHDIIRPRAVARGLPLEYVIEVTSHCNLACPMCPREISPTVGNQDMSLDTFYQVFDRIRDTAAFVWFAGLGEPMMNKHFMQMIQACKKAGISTGASTNGTFLTTTWQDRIYDSGLDLLIVSFDGATKETYEKIRVGADFDKVRQNTIRFAARKVERGATKPWLILQMIELAETKDQASAFRDMWKLPGVDAIRVKKDELQFDESLAFDGQRQRRASRPCPFLWRGTVYVHSDGAISPCCYGSHDKSFGNLNEASIEKLWNSHRLSEIRRSHLEGRGLDEPFCKNCNTFQPGKVPMAASVLIPSLTQKKHAGVVETLNRWVRFME